MGEYRCSRKPFTIASWRAISSWVSITCEVMAKVPKLTKAVIRVPIMASIKKSPFVDLGYAYQNARIILVWSLGSDLAVSLSAAAGSLNTSAPFTTRLMPVVGSNELLHVVQGLPNIDARAHAHRKEHRKMLCYCQR